MRQVLIVGFITASIPFLITSATAQDTQPPTLADFWSGQAEWVLEIFDVGLPVGESDSIPVGADVYWSYLHASHQSAGVIDQCGQAVEFPGCATLWTSADAAQNFSLSVPVCMLPCESCPCDDQRDHITAQQYPRVFVTGDLYYMVYEWHAQTILRTSTDGVHWSLDWDFLTIPGGKWPRSHHACLPVEAVGEHPNIRGEGDVCLVGGPPGLYVEGDTLYIFVMAGSAPAHMRCYKGNRHADLSELEMCNTDPLFGGSAVYGPLDVFEAAANAYFDFRFISSADVIRVADYYYMAYEGIRGPSELEFGRDNQFGLGFARAQQIDGTWEVYEGNPILNGLEDNWGVGHADLLIIDGVTYMITATSQTTRGRYQLVWKPVRR